MHHTCCNGATNLWTIKIKSLYMLWSQYKLATIRHTEFLRKEITGIPNTANRNSDFLTLQTSEFQKHFPNGIFGIKNGIRIPLMMGVPEIRTKNWNSQTRVPGSRYTCINATNGFKQKLEN
jgi:hypothetical protein